MSESFDIQWIDAGREPQCPPNPDYPNGITIDLSFGAKVTCDINLGYPAPRCGVYDIKCKICGWHGRISTAGRVDDPKSLRVACRSLGSA